MVLYSVTLPFYFVVAPAGTTLDGAEQHQATFTVIRTLTRSVAAYHS